MAKEVTITDVFHVGDDLCVKYTVNGDPRITRQTAVPRTASKTDLIERIRSEVRQHHTGDELFQTVSGWCRDGSILSVPDADEPPATPEGSAS